MGRGRGGRGNSLADEPGVESGSPGGGSRDSRHPYSMPQPESGSAGGGRVGGTGSRWRRGRGAQVGGNLESMTGAAQLAGHSPRGEDPGGSSALASSPCGAPEDPSALLVALVEHHKHRVVHIKRAPYDVYVGRASAGKPADADPDCPWGNPFSSIAEKSKSQGDITARTRRYLHWLFGDPAMVERVRAELPGKVLGCWCTPKYCHGWVLAALANCSSEDCELLCAACAAGVAEEIDVPGDPGEASPFFPAVARICAEDCLVAKGGRKGKGRGKAFRRPT